VVLLAILAGALMLLHTPLGVGVGYDSMYYINAAEGVRAERGLVKVGSGGDVVPLNHFPPLYPLALALVAALLDTSAIEAARWLGVFFYAINIGLIGVVVHQATGSWPAAVIAAVFGLISPKMLEVHLDAMSEPFFFSALLVAFWMLGKYFDTNSRRWIVGAGLLAGVATLVRYIGATVLITGGLGMLFWGKRGLWERVKTALWFGLSGAALISVWIVRNALLAGSATNRSIGFHPVSSDMLRRGAVSISTWFLPQSVSSWMRLGVTALFGLCLFVLVGETYIRWHQREPRNWTPKDILCVLPALYAFVYLVSLGMSMTFIDASTPLTNRILSPVYLMLLILVPCLVAHLLGGVRRRGLLLTLVAILGLGLAISYIPQSVEAWGETRQEGRRLTSRAWRESETMDLLRGMGPAAVIYTNEPQPAQLHTGIPAFRAPEKWDSIRDQVPENYDQWIGDMRRDLQRRNSALVIFHPADLRKETAPMDVLTKGLELAMRTEDAVIYVHPSNLDQWPAGR
jgi:hypothetical protein